MDHSDVNPDQGPVLVMGYDQAPSSQAALRVAADLARRMSAAHLHVVHAANLRDYPIDPDSADWEAQAEATWNAERDQVHTLLADLATPWTYHLEHMDPTRLITALCDEHNALMIIIGTRGEGSAAILSRLLERSVSHALLRTGHRPVLIVPEHGDDRTRGNAHQNTSRHRPVSSMP
ncbi:universal stress protein [Actinoplanes solisilvae]|uniref:universal stress protein n=1 Tax=Actinoplanes solisilvae TaxID=2486853 RepID=UPI0013E3DCC3|nr:universal stress protein [Actinoplanes solisilvae]